MPPEVQKQLWDLLEWRDDVYRDFIRQLAMVPGLSELIDNLTDALNACACSRLSACTLSLTFPQTCTPCSRRT